MLYLLCGMEIKDMQLVHDLLYIPDLITQKMNGKKILRKNKKNVSQIGELEICGTNKQ